MSLVTLAFVLGLVLVNNDAFAESSVVSTASITVPVACTMTGTGTVHTAILNPGTYSGASGSGYENGIGKTTLTAICNDDNGFSIYAIGYTGDSYDSANHTKLVGSSTGLTVDTAVYASGDTTSSWSMKVNKVTDSSVSYNPANMSIQNSFDNWHTIPATYTKVAQYHANTGSSVTDTTLGAKVETTYAAYMSTNQSSDVYVGQVKYTMVHPYDEAPVLPQTSASGKICYYANASNAVGTMGCQDVASSVTLLASNFSRTGYGFAGWSDKFDYTTNNEASFYGPQEDLSIPDTSIYTGEGKGLSLYAVWVKSQGNLQDTSKVASVCSNLTTAPTNGTANLSSVSALTDQRDNQTYAIAKLADGKCWMIENLRLDNAATLTLANTNNPLNDGTDVTLKHNYTDTQTYNTLSATSNVAYYADTAPDGWCTDNYSAACDDQSRLRTDNTANRATNNPNTNSSAMYSYGNYYNWYSATAGRGTYSFNTNNNSTAGDLCPSGWRLPKGGDKTRIESNDDNEFWNLTVDALNSGTNPSNYDSKTMPYYNGTAEAGPVAAKLRSYPNNYLYSGYVSGVLLRSRGSNGGYWLSTAYSSNLAYNLYLSSSGVYPGTYYDYKYYGRALRCIASS